MSSMRCACGASIDDISDHLSHKGRLLSDIEYFDMEQNLENVIEQWLKSNPKRVVGDAVTAAARKLAQMISTRRLQSDFRTVFVCIRCGRLYIQQQRERHYLEFLPSEKPVSGKTFGILTSLRGRMVRGIWNGSKGNLYWEKFAWDEKGQEIPNYQEFADWLILESKYHKLLERLKEAEVPIREAFLMDKRRVIHQFCSE
jgi:hypothetical protein